MQHYNTSNKGNNQAVSLAFNGVNLNPVERDGKIWMTSADLAKALGYADVRSVTKIHSRNADEFTSAMTTVVKLTTVRKTGNIKMDNRIFSLRGCHLIAMFANTKIAKDFRVWVLDILDREVGAPVTPVASQPTVPTDTDWQRYAQSMTIPEMAQLTGYNEREVVNALHKVMGGRPTRAYPAPVMTQDMQDALDQFWGFVATQNIAALNHSHALGILAISIPEIYAMADKGTLPDSTLLYRALRLSDAPRFYRANVVMHSAKAKRSQRVWVFFKSIHQKAIGN